MKNRSQQVRDRLMRSQQARAAARRAAAHPMTKMPEASTHGNAVAAVNDAKMHEEVVALINHIIAGGNSVRVT